MFDFGWAELLVIAAIAVLVIGPKELPAIMHTLGRIVRRLQYMRFALSQQFEDFMMQNELNELRRDAAFRLVGDDKSEKDADENFMEPLPKPVPDESESRKD